MRRGEIDAQEAEERRLKQEQKEQAKELGEEEPNDLAEEEEQVDWNEFVVNDQNHAQDDEGGSDIATEHTKGFRVVGGLHPERWEKVGGKLYRSFVHVISPGLHPHSFLCFLLSLYKLLT